MNRVVITGLGTINPLGSNLETVWKNLKLGNYNFEFYTPLNIVISRVEEEIDGFLSKRELRYQDRVSQLAMISTKLALQDSKLSKKDLNDSILSVGTSIGGVDTTVEEVKKATIRNRVESMGVRTVIKMLPNMIASNLSIKYGIQGPNYTYCEACASSNVSLGEAFEKIKYGKSSVAIAVGTESCLNENALESFNKLGVLSNASDLSQASIPFTKNRNGFVMSEGASTLILESFNHAKSRHAKIYGEITGYGNCSDAVSLVAPSYEGMKNAMKEALAESNLLPSNVTYLNAHGTSTEANDESEERVIESVFGSELPYLSSTKAVTGHLLGAAGTTEALFCLLMLDHHELICQYGITNNTLEGTETFKRQVLRKNIKLKSNRKNYILSNSFAFGGIDSSLIFSSYN